MPLRAVAEVNLAAIERNAERLRRRLHAHTRLCAVVKADAYGHGAAPAARAALAGGASMLAVATASEAAGLREAGLQAPILVLGALSPEELDVALAAAAEITAWEPGFVRSVAARAASAPAPIGVHVKLDTGLGRLGTRDVEQALDTVRAVLAAGPRLRLAGVMTHLATADGDLDFAAAQLRRFGPFVAESRALATTEITVHAANSAALLRLPDSHFDMVRAGLALYGGDPLHHDPADHGLEPALALRSYVAALKPITAGQSVGYGRRFIAAGDGLIATLPIGYADGVPRALADNCEVLIGGRRMPLRGMVSMDNITVEVGSDDQVTVGQRATLIGTDGDERQTVEELAGRVGTISYELLCWISRRVPRQYHRDGAPA
ncbi:alanine racemase [Conexibacter sp. S30A1]|jgi:alanine racemase|uniref:alanine racemase n=1 Tax=Conexibacter sp. S30A1 TaxID=2937800 RepID=UPI00200CAD9B|nr:alanine racemase [Conexibacter sp. S30A1]